MSMSTKVIDVVLRLKDEATHPLKTVTDHIKEHSKKWEQAGRKIQRTGKTITGVGKSLTTHVTAPIVGLGTAAVKTAADFEKGMSDVAAITNGSSKAMEKLSEKAKSMDDLGFAADEVTEAYKYMGMAGWNTKQMLQGVEPVMKLAAASNTDLGRTSDIVTDALTAFGAKAKDTGRLTDILATASTKSNTNVEMLGETFKYVAPVAGAMNYTMEETAAIAGLMANAGIKASNAGTAMRSAFTNLVAPTKDAAEGMAAIGIDAEKIKTLPVKQQMDMLRETFGKLSKAEQAAAAKAIAGKNGMSGLLAVVNASKKDYKGLTSAIEGASGATDRMFKKSTNNLQGDLKKVKASLKNIGTDFGTLIMPYVKKGIGYLQKGIKWLKSLTDEERKHILKIAGIAAAIGPAVMMLGKVTTGIGTVVKAVGTFGKAVSSAGSIIGALTSPVTIIVGLVAAIGAAVAFCATHWDEMKDSVMACYEAIRPIIDAIKSAFGGLFDSITGGSKASSGKMTEFFKGAFKVIEKILGWIAPIIAKIVTAVGKVVGTIANVVGGIFNKLKEFYEKHKEQIDGILKTVQQIIGAIVDVITTVLEPVIEGIGAVIGGIIDACGGVIDFIEGVFTGDWSKAWEGIKEIAMGPIRAIDEALDGIFSKHASNLLDWLGVGMSDDSVERNQKIRGWLENHNWINEGYHYTTDSQGKINSVTDKFGTELLPNIEKEIEGKAVGTRNWKGGIVQISERGGEIVDLPSGSRIYPHDKSVEKAYADGAKTSSSNITYNVNVSKFADELIVREDADIDRIATAIADKLEKVSQNIGSGRISYSYQN